jgi:hypothetical protein
MNSGKTTIDEPSPGKFHLSKWFLDFTGDNGDAMIFYAAKLKWHGWTVSYTSWLHYREGSGVKLKYRFHHVQYPRVKEDRITWADSKFGVSGIWESQSKAIQSRIFDSPEGSVDWTCFQPASKVRLQVNEEVLEGAGYAEQLVMTVPPWKIPMDELRWGRFGSPGNNLVWIELNEKVKRQWLWLNGEKIENCFIGDDHITVPYQNLVLHLDRSVVLESEKKISSLIQKMIRYMPGINRLVPANFLMADEFKWLSRGELHRHGDTCSVGMAIHELVNFKPIYP